MPSAAKMLLQQMSNNSPTATTASYSSESDGDGNRNMHLNGTADARSDILRAEAELTVDQVEECVFPSSISICYYYLHFVWLRRTVLINAVFPPERRVAAAGGERGAQPG